MNQTIKYQIVSYFAEDWGESSPQFNVCKRIFDYLLSRPFEQITHLTFSVLRKVIGKEYSNVEILKVIPYLCGDRVHILSLHFEFVDENDNYIELEDEEVRQAKNTGKLVHPRTGEYIEDFENKVFMYFTPSSLIQEVQNS
jgi:hypothetical protein